MSINYEEWMSDGDALTWNIERDPVLRSTVVTVWILDRTSPSTQVEHASNRCSLSARWRVLP